MTDWINHYQTYKDTTSSQKCKPQRSVARNGRTNEWRERRRMDPTQIRSSYDHSYHCGTCVNSVELGIVGIVCLNRVWFGRLAVSVAVFASVASVHVGSFHGDYKHTQSCKALHLLLAYVLTEKGSSSYYPRI